MRKHVAKFCLLLVATGSALALPWIVRAAPLVYSAPTTVSLTSPAVTLTIAAGSFADALQVNATSVAVTLSGSTGGTFTLTSPRALASSTVGTGGNLSQTCASGIETDTITQTGGSEIYTLTPTGSACVQPSSGGGTTTATSTAIATSTPPSGSVGISTGGGGSAYDLSINGGAATTATTSVMLSLYGTAAYTMELSNAPDFSSRTWIPYATSLPWTLAPEAGEQAVYVQYRSVSGDVVGGAEASIDFEPSSSGSGSPASSPAGSQSVASLAAELASLRSQLAALLAEAGKPTSAPEAPVAHFTFTRALASGMSGRDVAELQKLLAEDPALYPEGKVTGYFGELTLGAVRRFQRKYGLAKPGQGAYGYVGSATRAKLNALIREGVSP